MGRTAADAHFSTFRLVILEYGGREGGVAVAGGWLDGGFSLTSTVSLFPITLEGSHGR